MSNWYDGIEDRAVAAYRANGLKAVPGRFAPSDNDRPDDRTCCALGAINLGTGRYGRWVEDWARLMGAPYEELWDFIYAFDRALLGRTIESDKAAGGATGAGYRTAVRVQEEGLAL